MSRKDFLETYPAWSPNGRFLYFSCIGSCGLTIHRFLRNNTTRLNMTCSGLATTLPRTNGVNSKP